MRSPAKKSIKETFLNELTKVVKDRYTPEVYGDMPHEFYDMQHDDGSSVWKHPVVDIETFCEIFIGEPLFPVQAGFAVAMTGETPFTWDLKYKEGHGFWGKGSGKDRTIAKLQAYVAYKLLCMENPQKTLREIYGCSIGDDDAIDLCNVAINARQAINVFFKKFKNILNMCTNPETKKNWFYENGVDMREGYDVQKTEITFPNGITAHSLNSATYTGEGLSPFFVTLDEFGAFDIKNAFVLLNSLRDSCTSRFKNIGKICVISYKYHENDAMHVLYEKERNNKKVYSSRAATWDVNPIVTKATFADSFARDPERAKMTYECLGGTEDEGFVSIKQAVDIGFSPKMMNPVETNAISVKSNELVNLKFKDWFNGDTEKFYCVHVDLAKGIIERGLDACGFSLAHPENLKPEINKTVISKLAKKGISIEFQKSEKRGAVIDLALQIVAQKGGEVQASDIRKFIFRLIRDYNFNIISVTYDGWQSLESMQILNESGIESKLMSPDRDPNIYQTWKDMLYQNIVRCYPHAIAVREAKELIYMNGKVDHPVKSFARVLSEGVDHGSKDVIDAIATTTVKCLEMPFGATIHFC